ncbi:hypothetical protein [Pseudoalteromonas phage PH357]|nr:hypothetical protein [Pseudoalteromonas phage PH357]
MKKILKIVKFTILDSQVSHIKPSDLGSKQELMFWMRDNLPEVVTVGSVIPIFPKNSEIVCWYDDKIKGTRYVQKIYEEEV